MLLTAIPFWVFIQATKAIAFLGPVGLPIVSVSILLLSVRGIPPTVESIKSVLGRIRERA